jgi:multiple sugar transport system substrate-binding protein
MARLGGGRPVTRRRAASCAVALAALALGCAGPRDGGPVTLRFWAMGREGEVVSELVRDFEREHPNVRVDVQQIPWTAAHEKLLTGFVGESTPDIAQLGNTWVPEFVALEALEPLSPWLARSASLAPTDFFAGIWDTNVIDGEPYGVPWYVDTRVLFYRRDLLERAGVRKVPETWDEWLASMEAIKRLMGEDRYAIFLPTNEYTQPIVFGLQAGSTLLRDHDTRGDFSGPEYRRAFDFYMEIFRRDLAPPISNNQISNMYQEFARGYFSMVITGPWNIGEFERRLPPELQSAWATAPLPGPTGPASGVSVAGGSSLVVFRASRHKAEAWQLIEFLSRPEQQLRFLALTGDLPARVEAWEDSALTANPRLHAFATQLARTVATPKVPEWEQIAIRLQDQVEVAVRGAAPPDSALAQLDRIVDRILEKRRWLLAHRARGTRGPG